MSEDRNHIDYSESLKLQGRVAIAMSGGVDSSVAAALLVEQGVDVFGLMMRLWGAGPDRRNRCCSPEDVSIARSLAEQLDIPFHVVDVQDRFKKYVVDPFIDGYANGITPNPCLICNRFMRWGTLLHQAREMGATHLATGHYARLEMRDGVHLLLRGKDRSKDQSYVLSILNQDDLAHTLFPLGEYTKDKVRQYAKRIALPVAEKPDSQDLCFVTEGDYRDFLRQQGVPLPPPGPIVDQMGNILGQHQGLTNYTIGQRRGLGIAMSHPLYVIEKVLSTNTLVVGPIDGLGRKQFLAGPVNWIRGQPPEDALQINVQVRYKANEVEAFIELLQDGFVEVKLSESIPDITPGQSAVFYNGEVCLGGGVIRS